MAIIQTQIDTNSAEYQQNSEAMSVAVDEVRTIERRVIELARSKEERYIQRGLLVPRERLTHLLDRGAPLLEMSTHCGYMQEGDKDGSAAGGSCVTGLGYVKGTLCAILVDD